MAGDATTQGEGKERGRKKGKHDGRGKTKTIRRKTDKTREKLAVVNRGAKVEDCGRK